MVHPEIFQKKNDPFFISHRKMTNHHGKHVHSSYEILYLFSGERSFFINDRTFKMQPGDLCLIHPNVLHKATSEGCAECEGILLYFYENFLSPNQPLEDLLTIENVYLPLPVGERLIVEGLLLKMLHEYTHQPIGYRLSLQALTLELLAFIIRYLHEHQTGTVDFASPMHEKVSEIARYITSHYMDDLSLVKLSHLFYISPSYLSKVFKRVTNFTLIEYLNNVRVKEAKRLLAGSHKKVVQIAEEVGFGSITHFGRVFKEITGNPPNYYRKHYE